MFDTVSSQALHGLAWGSQVCQPPCWAESKHLSFIALGLLLLTPNASISTNGIGPLLIPQGKHSQAKALQGSVSAEACFQPPSLLSLRNLFLCLLYP